MDQNITRLQQQVIEAGLTLQRNGLIARTWGNISARISETQFVVTPSGRAYGTLTPNDIVTVNIADLSYEGQIRPSSESGMHAAIYRERPDVSFIIHTHQNYASALSVTGEPIADIRKMDADVSERLGDIVPCAKYGLNGSEQLNHAVTSALRSADGCHAVLMRNHGIVTFDTDYDHAFADALALENIAARRYRQLVGDMFPEGVPQETMNMFEHYQAGYEEPHLVPQAITQSLPALQSGDSTGAATVGNPLYAVHAQWPFTLQLSRIAGEGELPPYLDDCASDIGVTLRVLKANPSQIETAVGLADRNAVILQGRGALCVADSPSDVEAVRIVLEKNCMAALLFYAGIPVAPVHPDNAEIDRENYVRHYARLIDTNLNPAL